MRAVLDSSNGPRFWTGPSSGGKCDLPKRKPSQVTEFELAAMHMAREEGWSFQQIADHLGYSKTSVQRLLAPRTKPPEEYEQVYPVNGLTPASEPTVIKEGDEAICMVSHKTGHEEHPKFRPDRPKPKKESKHKFKPRGRKSKKQIEP